MQWPTRQHRETAGKAQLVARIADAIGENRIRVKGVVQEFMDGFIEELGKGHRLEFRGFGVFSAHTRGPRRAQNPKTLEPVQVAEKRPVKFKAGRILKKRIDRQDQPAESTEVILKQELGSAD